eukprot:TRINITY_DN5296_c1_g1_i2.p1 TRINITY_DN5296_c1_g1~~TRINITY_DN5296_c1_g1_i2.p1  ORF type:complete len:980 (-),score=402.34 TRINITY_DN5296_c1_g1_i2:1936-4875(-)
MSSSDVSSSSNADQQQQDQELAWPAKKIRSTFLDYFGNLEHDLIDSSPVVPLNDPTLMFANAGMNQFKSIFLGTVDPQTELAQLKRAASTQKCIRAGGKHNDLEDVGKDTYHHTFFEMLGNWSFGDYFKEEAIDWAWELLVNVYGLDPERMYATYFEGNESVPCDDEAREIWKKYLPENRIIGCDAKDNFWEMGDTGPCGPCSEIHYDIIGGRECPERVNADEPDVIEIWNLVFMQFNRESETVLKPLPAKHVDTGMGFERVTCILQGKDSNYDTDVFGPIFRAIENVCPDAPHGYTSKMGKDDEGRVDMAYRVIADHIRTLTFAISDGGVPNNEGRGYVVRRILRRACRFGREILNAPLGFLNQLVDVVVQEMGEQFPDIVEYRDIVVDIIAEEEEAFANTLDKGIKHFKTLCASDEVQADKKISGEDSFKLYDTFGFPFDLTQLMAEEVGITVLEEDFNTVMEASKAKSKANSKKKGKKKVELTVDLLGELHNKYELPATDDISKYVWDESHTTTVQKFVTLKDGFVDSITGENSKEIVGVLCASTNFYGESGGQVADIGSMALTSDAGTVMEIIDAKVYGGYVLHLGKVISGTFNTGDQVTLEVNYAKRQPIANNHTFTHVLNYALRQQLGNKCHQRGSLVDGDKLRFDFSFKGPVPIEKLEAIEARCNQVIDSNLKVYMEVVPLRSAKKINTLRAVFGEVYPDPVRVVSVGVPVQELLDQPENPEWLDYSVEFCGGTHISQTTSAGHFAIVMEEGIARGVRRIVAFTGAKAQELVDAGEATKQEMEDIAAMEWGDAKDDALKALKRKMQKMQMPYTVKTTCTSRIEDIAREATVIKREQVAKAVEASREAVDKIISELTDNGDKFVAALLGDGLDPSSMRDFAAQINAAVADTPVFFASCDESKASKQLTIVAEMPDAICKKIKAGDLIKHVAREFGGKGGGRPNKAQGSIDDASVAKQAVEVAQQWLGEKMSEL